MKWEPVVSVTLPYPISANDYWGRRWVKPSKGKPGFVQDYITPEARAYRETVQWTMSRRLRGVITGRVRVDIQLYPRCPLDWKKRMADDPLHWDEGIRRLDLDNCRKVLMDALTNVAIVDDFWIWKDTGEVMEPDPTIKECVVVRISRCIHDNPQQEIEQQAQPQEVSSAFP